MSTPADQVPAGLAETAPDEHHRISGHSTEATTAAAAGGVMWSTVALLVRQIGRLGFAILLARWIGPADFGIAAEATIYVALNAMLLETGFASLVVQRDRLRDADVGAAQTLSMGVALVIAALTVLLAGPIAGLMNSPQLAPVLMWLSVCPILKALAVVPAGYINRYLRFRALAVTEILATIAGGAAGITAAVSGMGYWALVVQQISTDVLVAVCMLVASGWLPWRTDRAAIRETASFGGKVITGQGLGYLTRNLDSVLIASVLGAVPLAFYTIAYRVMTVPVQLLGSAANRISFPVFSRLQDRPADARRLFLRSSQVMAMAVFPVMITVALAAREIVALVFGEVWLPAVPAMQVLAVTSIIQVLVTASGALYLAAARVDLTLRWSIIPLVVCSIAFVAGLPWGITGVAVAYCIATFLLAPFQLRAAGNLVSLRLREWVWAILPFTWAGAIATVSGLAVRWVLADSASWLILLAVVVAVPATFLGALAVRRRDLIQMAVRAGKMILKGRSGIAV